MQKLVFTEKMKLANIGGFFSEVYLNNWIRVILLGIIFANIEFPVFLGTYINQVIINMLLWGIINQAQTLK
jgi:hypothetical protein